MDSNKILTTSNYFDISCVGVIFSTYMREQLINSRSSCCECSQGVWKHFHLLLQLAGIHVNTINNKDDGTIDLEEIKQNLRSLTDTHMPLTRVNKVHTYGTYI